MEKIFISGGAGFIGSNLARLYLGKGSHVVVYDNLSRPNSEKNLQWLRACKKGKLEFIKGDIRELRTIKRYIKDCSLVFHEAAQVAVTKSLEAPIEDFEINATGTLYMLEAIRQVSPNSIFIYASTNKVYGSLEDVDCVELKTRYKFNNRKYNKGISEERNLDFHSPYGCSKGAGDQYVRDYARVYGLKTIVFRQSCIYGQRQFGSEDQGWVIHFVRHALEGKPITIYGDGKQVRDLLYIEDLLNAYQLAIKKIRKSQGEVFNIGGGIENAFSLIELIEVLGKLLGKDIKHSFSDWREGDQKIYISDNSKLEEKLGWKSKIDKSKGVEFLIEWAKTI